MCGISGIISRSEKEILPSLIRVVNNCMAHRGPDADGFFTEGPVALGHRRLSILDLSSAANQPFHDASGRYVMVFNGEIYNFRDIRRMLGDHLFKTTGDTEVVIEAFAKWGPDCLHHLKGMFAIAIWDRAENSLFLARDRFGVKPLYYYKATDRFLFASEIRSILASGWPARRVNRTALTDYLKYQSVIAPHTMVEEVRQVPAGTWIMWKDDELKETVYWDITRQYSPGQDGDPVRVRRRIKDLLFQSVERRLVSDVPLGAFLSGGIDSSAVVAIMSQIDRSSTNAFTIAFEEKEYNELPYAELVAKKFGINHSRVLLRPADFLDKLPAALDALDTPSGDGVNTYVVSEAIKGNGITVALSGVGGDELFAGYPMFTKYSRLRQRDRLFNSTRWFRRTAAALLPGVDQRNSRLRQLLASPSPDISDIYTIFRQIHTPYSLSRLLKGNGGSPEKDTVEKLLADKQAEIGRFGILSQISIAEYLAYTQNVLLKDMDQMGMAVSLELREPFFDNDLVEYVLNIPDQLKYPDYPKKLMVESLDGLLPEEIVFRKKQGFVLPYDLWLRNELRSFCDTKIRNLADREYFASDVLMEYWNSFLSGRSSTRWMDIWVFVVLGHWLDKNSME